jgi:hypothetical protein
MAIAGYASNLNQEQFQFFIGMKSSATVVDWKSHFREMCRIELNVIDDKKNWGAGYDRRN